MKTNPIFESLMDRAYAAGRAAGEKCVPTPVGWVQGDILTGRPVPGAAVERCNEGVCGFAWVRLKGNTAFGRWARKAGHARPGYPSGLNISTRLMTQSMERNEAAACAMRDVLREAGIDCWMESRID